MKTDFLQEPRVFYVLEGSRAIKDFGKIKLDPREMISFQTESGRECDFTATEWGFYPTPSVNRRLKAQGFKTALVRYDQDKLQINVVEEDKMADFEAYLSLHDPAPKVVLWLDELSDRHLKAIEKTRREIL